MKWLSVLFALLAFGCLNQKTAVRIDLPLPPKLDLAKYQRVYLPGFLAEDKNEEFDSANEAYYYFRREFVQQDVVDVLEQGTVDLSGRDPRAFFVDEQPFFKNLDIEQPDKTLVITGLVNYSVVDRSSFRQVRTEYRGQPFYRTQFVEVTGYLLKMRVFVYELNDGRLLYRELLQDEIDVEGPPGDTKLAFYSLLERLSGRILGLFIHTNVKAERNLL